MNARNAKFAIGQVVRHRVHPFRGVIFDVDPVFANTDDWWEQIPEDARPSKDQPFYHLLAENEQTSYVAYVSEQNLMADESGRPIGHPHTGLIFDDFESGRYHLKPRITH
ncbi:MAG: heat shock protein HspQ [Caulobacteraceae bacterium]